jgi:hypothetical protein
MAAVTLICSVFVVHSEDAGQSSSTNEVTSTDSAALQPHGWIGIQVQPVTSELANSLGLKSVAGARDVSPTRHSRSSCWN